MRAFVVVSALVAACRAEASLPLAYHGYAAAGLPYAAAYGPYAVPAALNTYAAAPVYAAAPAVYAAAAPVAAPSVHSSQYRAGDELGNTAFGYSNINSARQEQGNAEGVTGSYSYVDEAGLHTVNYVADAYGFRATGDNLPVPVYGRKRRSVGYAAPLTATYAAAPFAAPYAGHFAAPLAANYAAGPLAAAPLAAAYAAPGASREAVLTTVQLNPGHAVFYRVD